jgi:hypothetical protein
MTRIDYITAIIIIFIGSYTLIAFEESIGTFLVFIGIGIAFTLGVGHLALARSESKTHNKIAIAIKWVVFLLMVFAFPQLITQDMYDESAIETIHHLLIVGVFALYIVLACLEEKYGNINNPNSKHYEKSR